MFNFRMKIEKCTVDIESFMFTAFTIYQFVLCYCVPLLLIAFFYTKLLRKLSEHARSFKVTLFSFKEENKGLNLVIPHSSNENSLVYNGRSLFLLLVVSSNLNFLFDEKNIFY